MRRVTVRTFCFICLDRLGWTFLYLSYESVQIIEIVKTEDIHLPIFELSAERVCDGPSRSDRETRDDELSLRYIE